MSFGERHPVVGSLDLWIGLACGLGAGVAAALSRAVRLDGVIVTIALAAIDVAILGVALVAMQLFLALLDPDYALAIEESTGIQKATRPYLVVSILAGGGTIISVMSTITWHLAPPAAAGAMLAVATWVSVWAIVGTIQLVGLSLFHSGLRSRLAVAEAKARAIRGVQGRSA